MLKLVTAMSILTLAHVVARFCLQEAVREMRGEIYRAIELLAKSQNNKEAGEAGVQRRLKGNLGNFLAALPDELLGLMTLWDQQLQVCTPPCLDAH